jgi:ubiquinone/menaquinone biosynthesis C-methylase UbiE
MSADAHLPAMYTSLASWFHLVTAPADYAEEAAEVLAVLRHHVDGSLQEALELGSGGGNLASHLKHQLTITLTDVSPDMLALSRTINPECDHVQGDMRTLRLGRQFDAVVVHDAIAYMTTENDARAALETAYAHTRPGGAAVFLPDEVRETFAESVRHGGHDGDGRSLRYLEWSWDPDPTDTSHLTDFAYLLREGGDVRVVHDRHVLGLFPRDTWMRLVHEVGYAPEAIVDPWQRMVVVGRRPLSSRG